MIEYSSHRIDPSIENEFLQLKECFGWHLVDSNEVYNENTYVSNIKTTSYDGVFGSFMRGFTGNDGKIEVTTQTNVTNYIHMRFARDTDISHYDQIRSNEEKFWNYAETLPPNKPVKATAIGAVAAALIFISLFMSIITGTGAAVWEIAVCVAVPTIAALVIIFMWRHYKKRNNFYHYAMEQAQKLLSESKDLLYT